MKWAALLTLGVGLAAPAWPQEVAGILVKREELPVNIKFVKGMPCASRQPRAYFETPDPEKLLGGRPVPKALKALFPKPTRKECQSFAAEGGTPGSVFLFEYSDKDVISARRYFPGYLWGDRGRTPQHPEELLHHGNLVWVLSFPRGDPAAEWYKERLRKKFRVPAVRWRPELLPLGKQIAKAYTAEDADAGIRILEANKKVAHGWAFGQHTLGEFGVMKQDWPTAERGYRRALELHETLEDPLEESLVWADLDGLGMALLYQRKMKEAVDVLAKAKEFADQRAIPEGAQSAYNLACAYALLKRWADAHSALKDAIDADPEYRKYARTDEDLALARKREEFRALLK